MWVNWPTAAHSRECLAVCIKIAGRHNPLTTSCEGHPQQSLRAGPVSAARLCVHSAVLSNNLVRPASGTATLWPGVPLGAEPWDVTASSLQNLPWWLTIIMRAFIHWLIFLSICQESSLIFHKQLSKSPLKTFTHMSYAVSLIFLRNPSCRRLPVWGAARCHPATSTRPPPGDASPSLLRPLSRVPRVASPPSSWSQAGSLPCFLGLCSSGIFLTKAEFITFYFKYLVL